jgi:hypothetical protein
MAPLTAYVRRLREARPDSDVPDFDPTQAGLDARVLILLEAPGRLGATIRRGSGFISPDNDDPTAENTWTLMLDAGLDRRWCINWNVVPWYVGTDAKLDRPSSADLLDAAPATRELLAILPNLRVILLLGGVAKAAWSSLGIAGPPAIAAPHPSPRNLRTRPHYRDLILNAMQEARQLAEPDV